MPPIVRSLASITHKMLHGLLINDNIAIQQSTLKEDRSELRVKRVNAGTSLAFETRRKESVLDIRSTTANGAQYRGTF